MQYGPGQPAKAPWPFPKARWIDLEFNKPPNGVQPIAKQEARPFQRSKQVADHRKVATFDPGKKKSRAACPINAAVNLGRLEIGIDFLIDAY
jgi:hypothetical protein